MKILLTAFILIAFSAPAFAQDAGLAERMELANKLNQVNPPARQIESSILRVGESWGLSEKEKFKREMTAKMDVAAINKTAAEALVGTFTKEELLVMIDYYSKPESAKIAEKMPIYQSLVEPVISKELDRALMLLRTGYEAQQAAPTAP